MSIGEGGEGSGVSDRGFGHINTSLEPAGGGGAHDAKMILIIQAGIRIKI